MVWSSLFNRWIDGYFVNIWFEVIPLRMIYSLRSMAVFSGHMLSPQSPRHFSALARLYYFACKTKTAVLRRLRRLRREIRSIVIDLGSTTYKGFKSANCHLHITLLLEIRVSQNLTRLEITSTTYQSYNHINYFIITHFCGLLSKSRKTNKTILRARLNFAISSVKKIREYVFASEEKRRNKSLVSFVTLGPH